jgi:hypothetical protein
MSALSKVEMSVSAPFWEFGGCAGPSTFGSARTATWRRSGMASSSDSPRLPSRSSESRLMPVVLRSGRASDDVKPSAIRSSEIVRIGIVFVAVCAAFAVTKPGAKIASGEASTSAVVAAASSLPMAPKPPSTTVRFCPSMNPASRNSSSNTAKVGGRRVVVAI